MVDSKDHSAAKQDQQNRKSYNPIKALSRLTANEKITAMLSFVTLVVSALGYLNAKDTGDLKSAVNNLSNLASQTKRQADALNGQFGVMQSEQEALARQASASQASAFQAKRSADVTERGIVAQNRPG